MLVRSSSGLMLFIIKLSCFPLGTVQNGYWNLWHNFGFLNSHTQTPTFRDLTLRHLNFYGNSEIILYCCTLKIYLWANTLPLVLNKRSTTWIQNRDLCANLRRLQRMSKWLSVGIRKLFNKVWPWPRILIYLPQNVWGKRLAVQIVKKSLKCNKLLNIDDP